MLLRCFLICLWLTPLSYSVLFGQNTLSTSVYFSTDDYSLAAQSQNTLDSFLTLLPTQSPYFTLFICGNTDAIGSQSYNLRLSEQRARAVRAYFEKRGIAAERIRIGYDGESRPIADNNSTEGKRRNRRVDVIAEWSATPSVTSSSERHFPFDKNKKYAAQRIFQELKDTHQVFLIKTNHRDSTLIIGRKGTIVHLPPNVFGLPDGAEVVVKLKEMYSYADFFNNNLNTKSGNRMLVSGGMIDIQATHNGQPVEPVRDYLLMMPQNDSRSVPDGRIGDKDYSERMMQLFRGVTDNRLGSMDWQLPAVRDIGFDFKKTISQYVSLDSIEKSLTDTTLCYDMFKWRIDSFYLNKLLKNGKPLNEIAFIKYSDKRPMGYNFEGINENLSEGNCKKIAFKAAEKLHSWYRGMAWKSKHRVISSDLYLQFDTESYEGLLEKVREAKRLWQLAYGSIQTLKQREAAVSYYVYETRMWQNINCDYFMRAVEKSELVNLKTDAPVAPNTQVKLFFKKQKAVMDAESMGYQLGFKNIPKGEEALVVAVKIEEGISYLAMENIKAGSTPIKLQYKALTPEEIKQTISALR